MIVLSTLNARYIHASLGLRALFANLGELKAKTTLLELEITAAPLEVAERILALQPRFVGFGVYVWNTEPTLKVVQLLKTLRPELIIIIGGPEVSHELEGQPVVALADYVITGEADLAFAALIESLLEGQTPHKVTRAALPDLGTIALPYDEFSDDDLKHRLLYVEASRGCPYRCEFCLSSLDEKVRPVPLERLLPALERLLDRGATVFKFVDRTFNLDVRTSRQILEFFLKRLRPGLFCHFELVPDRLPPELREVIAKFPPGALQFEVGIQTLNPEVERLISRRQNHQRLEDNLRFLLGETGAHVHVDLIAGLPGEDVVSFAAGFDALVALRPHELQVGVLKRLKGTPIARHEGPFRLRYSPLPPFEILETSLLSFEALRSLRRFARVWDLFHNAGDFTLTWRALWPTVGSPFDLVMRLTSSLGDERLTGIALTRRFRIMFELLVELGWSRDDAAALLWEDYQRAGKSDRPSWLASLPDRELAERVSSLQRRQQRHRQASNRKALEPESSTSPDRS